MRLKATHCKKGHELTEDNVYYFKNGCRYCKTCSNARSAADAIKNIEKKRERQRAWIGKHKEKLRPKEARRHKLSRAMTAYERGESALSIEARTGIRNQVLYRHLARRKIERRRKRGAEYLCYWCGCHLEGKKKKVCSDPECLRAVGLPVPWSAEEDAELERLAPYRISRELATEKFPYRSVDALKHRLRAIRRRLGVEAYTRTPLPSKLAEAA